MHLYEKLKNDGHWLFKYRSFLPILLLPIISYYFYQNNFKDSNMYLIVSIIISYFGEFIRIITAFHVAPGTSGRNTRKQYAATINTTGIYSIVRHPLYLGNYFILLGPCIYTQNFQLIIIFSLIFWIYYERIMFAEEIFLSNKFNEIFYEWSKNVPAIIPSFKNYKKNINNSFNHIIEREYTGICGIIVMYTIILVIKNYIKNSQELLSTEWIIIFLINLSIYFSIRIYKKIIIN